ncbi:hypothetical protein PPYR_03310 [Photinus pyralis]|uniref:Uncharacterized protein n=1 Tax=Photinus pyralis TaxID=7054 RepID=A0A5N4A2F4_PHOPY|nr:uncharacterized protein LOC116161260 [Photinus pyralis]KAB0791510.1 hypothetical protein PPYR_03310 [Photinus pyralis]
MKVLKSTFILLLAFILHTTCHPFHPKSDLVHKGHKKIAPKHDPLHVRTDIKKKLRTLTTGKSKLAEEAQARLEVIRKQLQELMERKVPPKSKVSKVAHEVKNVEKKKRWYKLKKDMKRVLSRASIVGESRTKEVETTSSTTEKSVILQPEDLYS